MSKDWTPEELHAASNAMKAAGHMSYEEFCEAVDETTDAKRKIDAFARIQTDGMLFCPRCGKNTMKDQMTTNALSRHAQIYVCDFCGTDEALRDWAKQPLPLIQWAVAK